MLKSAGVELLIDVRLNNVSQLAGFTKRDDLAYFLQRICSIEYKHEPLLAPTQELLDSYRKKRINWEEYESRFLDLMRERTIEETIDSNLFERKAVLLCSEPTSQKCHRRLVLEYLAQKWGNLAIDHI